MIHSDPNQYLPILKKSNLFGLVKYWLKLVNFGQTSVNFFVRAVSTKL